MAEYIYYTGIGSKKTGKHSVKEFLDIMNKNFNIECTEFLPELDYKPCREYAEMNSMPIFDKNTNKLKTNTSKKYKKLFKQCVKYKKNTKKRKCNLEEYISFSGAEKKRNQSLLNLFGVKI